ncbi:hypothetical protein [Scytonema sp. NUACC21]
MLDNLIAKLRFSTNLFALKVDAYQREKLKAVPNWQEQLRGFVDRLISELPKYD